AWPVDAHRPKDRARQSGVEVLARQLLARQFALLIDIERPERSTLIGGRFDIAGDADGSAMNDPAHTAEPARLEHIPGTVDVDLPIDLVGEARFPIDRSNVIHHLAALHGLQ